MYDPIVLEKQMHSTHTRAHRCIRVHIFLNYLNGVSDTVSRYFVVKKKEGERKGNKLNRRKGKKEKINK